MILDVFLDLFNNKNLFFPPHESGLKLIKKKKKNQKQNYFLLSLEKSENPYLYKYLANFALCGQCPATSVVVANA